jgi:hypothetical protein
MKIAVSRRRISPIAQYIPAPFAVKLKNRGKAEVPDLDVHVLVDEEIAQLKVAMDDILLVKILR